MGGQEAAHLILKAEAAVEGPLRRPRHHLCEGPDRVVGDGRHKTVDGADADEIGRKASAESS